MTNSAANDINKVTFQRAHSSNIASPWQSQLAEAITDPEILLRRLDLPPTLLPSARLAAQQFPLRVPQSFVRRMKHGDTADPLLRQVLPLHLELHEHDGFTNDPVGDHQARRPGGVLHKYHGRVLLVTTGACPIHCRYCFRRHFPYHDAHAARHNWEEALSYVASDASVDEIILSGGDPLSLSDRRLKQLSERLNTLPQVKRLRIHTRFPVVIPARVTPELLNWISGLRPQCVVVLHINHPNELDAETTAALTQLRAAGATLFNQAVLLRGVNDNLETLVALQERAFAAGIIPYYLHMLDPVAGAAHFDVPQREAQMLYTKLRGRLPGFLVPTLVREVAGAPAKTPLLP